MGLYDSADYSDGGWTRPDNLLFFLLQRFFKRYFFSESVRLLIVFVPPFVSFYQLIYFLYFRNGERETESFQQFVYGAHRRICIIALY